MQAYQGVIGPELDGAVLAGDERHQSGGIGEALVPERHRGAARASLDLGHAGAAAQALDGDDLQQVLDLLG